MLPQTIFSDTDQPYGKSWSEWSELWWRWMISIPKDNNPGMGHDHQGSNQFQYNEDIIFLAGSFDIGNCTNHDVKVQYGKALFFPLINAINSSSEDPEIKTKEDLLEWSKHDIKIIAKKELLINGEPFLPQLVISEPFNVEYPPNNVFNADPGPTTAISCGYWVFLQPLPKGNYKIKASGSCSSGAINVNVNYRLAVR
jgi:hypothetical protein